MCIYFKKNFWRALRKIFPSSIKKILYATLIGIINNIDVLKESEFFEESKDCKSI